MLACSCTRRVTRTTFRSFSSSPYLPHSPTSSHQPFILPSSLPSSSTSPKEPSRSSYEGHVPINFFQRGLLAVGSAVMGLIDTSRHGPLSSLSSLSLPSPYLSLILTILERNGLDMIAVLSETTSGPFLSHLRSEMRKTPSGRQILRDRPRITEESVDLNKLAGMREGTFGRKYVEWLKRNRVTPDTRDPVSTLPFKLL